MQTFFVEHIETRTGRMRIVTDSERRLRAADWNDHEPRMQKLLQRHYGVGSVELCESSRPSTAARALLAYFEGDLSAVDELPTETNGTAFQRAVWSALRTIPAGRTLSYSALAGQIGHPKAVRAVGLANGANPIAIVVPVPPRDRRQCLADRLRRRTASQAMAARARARGAAVVRRPFTGTSAMNSEDSKRIVLAAWDAFRTRDLKQIAAVFTEDAEWLAPANNANATAVALNGPSHMVGPEQIARLIGTEIWKLFVANVSVNFKGVNADGNVVVIEQRMRAMLANGNAYDNDYCFVIEVADGRIRRVREYMDTAKGNRMVFGAAV